MKFIFCLDCENYKPLGGWKIGMRHCIYTKDCDGNNHFIPGIPVNKESIKA